MIELPSGVIFSSFTPTPLDFGFTIEPITGAALERQDRKGNRYQVAVDLAPMSPDTLRVVASRLIRAKASPIALPFVLQVPQGSPGAVVVDGAGQSGTTLNVRAVTPGYMCKEGYWLSITDAAGNHYLHNAAASSYADGTGDMAITLAEQLRHPFADGAVVRLAKPMISGLVMEDVSWVFNVHRRTGLSFTVREVA